MAPRPLKQVHPKPLAYATGREALAYRPELAGLAMDAIALWSIIEARLAKTLVELLGAQARPAMAMFSALTSSQAQMAALAAPAKTILPPDYAKTFAASLVVVKRSSKSRHKMAHWIWGYSAAIPDSLLLIDPGKFILHEVKYKENVSKGMNALAYSLQVDGVWVYSLDDLLDIYMEFINIQAIVFNLSGLTYKTGSLAETSHNQLLSEPQIQKQLAREKQRSQTTPESLP